jgi:4-hydroxybenzoate polyprenyltransferase
MRTILVYAQLVRLPNTFTSLADIFLGAVATGLLLSHWHVLLCLLAASTLLYWSGMVWNDYFDLDQDRLERPGRPIASGRITLRAAFTLGFALMLGGLAFAGLADFLAEAQRLRSLPIAAFLVVAIFLYDGVAKATWAGPVLMGGCRLLNVLLGLSIANVMPPFWGWLLAIIVGTYTAGVTWFARTEARLSSQSMLIAAAIVMLVALSLALTIPALALLETSRYAEPSWLFPYLLAGFGAYLGVAVLRAIRRPDPVRVQPVIKRAIFGLIVLDALMASAFAGSLGLLLVVLVIPGMILGRWLYST